jgi:ATP-dependent helicase/nuclease subunit A
MTAAAPSRSLADDAARARIAEDLDETLFVEAGAGSGKTTSLVGRVLALVESGVPMSAIATITFTEKAAAELRHRVRDALERRRDDASLDPRSRDHATAAIAELDTAAISTLHAFAQRILSEHPIEASLPPAVEVLDEVGSEVAFEDRWVRFRDALLGDDGMARTLLLALEAGMTLPDVRRLAQVLGDNWDVLEDPARMPWEDEEPPEVDVTGLLAAGRALVGRADACTDPADLLRVYLTETLAPSLDRLARADGELERLRLLRSEPDWRCGRGKGAAWRGQKESVAADLTALQAARVALLSPVVEGCLRRIALRVARFTLVAAQERRRGGHLEFHDLLVLARELLRGPHGPDVRRRLSERYQRLLLDEFQDTDPIQIDLAVLIAAEPDADLSGGWDAIPVRPGRLFFVGDPKQSIYRFRRADIRLFLAAQERFGPPVQLTTNFRTSPAVIDWVNAVFGALIAHMQDSQPAYAALDPAPTRSDPPEGPPVLLLGAAHEGRIKADALRDLEAADVAEAVVQAQTWSVSRRGPDGEERWERARLGDITILLPARTSLGALERALEERDIPYRAETSSLVYATREVRELLAAVRALADPTDELSLVTALRSPLFGCGDDDLHTWRVGHGGSWDLLRPPPDDVDPAHPVARAMAYLRTLHAELPWRTPAEVLDRIARDRRLFEVGYAQGRPRDLWRRLRFVIDQARAWSESEGGTLREYVQWSRLQGSESARVAETVLPETDDDAVRIMTIHGSKGLEFPITIVSGLTTKPRSSVVGVQVGVPPEGPIALKVRKDITTPEFEAFKPLDEQMGFHERLRLLYVACTRAKDHLVVSVHRCGGAKDERQKMSNAELLADAMGQLEVPSLSMAGGALPAPPPDPVGAALPPVDVWEAQRAEALRASGRWRSVGASDVRIDDGVGVLHAGAGDDVAEPDDPALAGLRKSPRDLELPPWQKGRYGTAIGRAVHAVLQTVDLATGEGIDAAAAGQAAAEGVVGREDEVAALARAAIGSPSVQAAAAAPARWRETYVATPVGDTTLEGYIDLLYRTGEGLVVVDYKTASAGGDLDERVAGYRAQGGAYAVAVEGATGQPVTRVVFVFLTPTGAVERDLPDLAGARASVLAALTAPAG